VNINFELYIKIHIKQNSINYIQKLIYIINENDLVLISIVNINLLDIYFVIEYY